MRVCVCLCGWVEGGGERGGLIHKVTSSIRTVNRRSGTLRRHDKHTECVLSLPVQPCSDDQCYMRRL